MPVLDDKLLDDFRDHIAELEVIEKWLSDVHYHPEFSNLLNRPVISMLITATRYLKDNLAALRQKYQLKVGS